MIFSDQRGFSHMEVMIAMTLFFVLSLPILQGFYQSAREGAFAKESYRGTLYGKSLMEETIYALNSTFDEYGEIDENMVLYQLLGYTEENFLARYDTEEFNFYIQIQNEDNEYYFYYGEENQPENFSEYTMEDTQFTDLYTYGAKIKFISQNFVTLENNANVSIENDFDTCRITCSADTNKDVFIHIDLNGEIYDETYLYVNNESPEHGAYLILEGENAQNPTVFHSGENTFIIRKKKGGCIKNYEIKALVTDKENRIIKQITTVYSYDYAR